jgi:hypothetical protein
MHFLVGALDPVGRDSLVAGGVTVNFSCATNTNAGSP